MHAGLLRVVINEVKLRITDLIYSRNNLCLTVMSRSDTVSQKEKIKVQTTLYKPF